MLHPRTLPVKRAAVPARCRRDADLVFLEYAVRGGGASGNAALRGPGRKPGGGGGDRAQAWGKGGRGSGPVQSCVLVCLCEQAATTALRSPAGVGLSACHNAAKPEQPTHPSWQKPSAQPLWLSACHDAPPTLPTRLEARL